ncbi:MAG: poly-gamma-glutamate synthase PgsB [Candidatus Syntrophosphaera sp.]
MTVLILATLLLIAYWTHEYWWHTRNVKSIPIRIHVNGTRGKSSVTRLIAAGLRAGNIRTVAKITGTLPRVVLPDGREAAIIRLMGANIIEQKYIFRHAVTEKPDAVVIECMAVNPVYQWVTERKFVRSTISVITNCRADHTDLMGSTEQSVTMSLSNTIPQNGVCYTAENEHFGLLKKVARHRHCKIHRIRPMDVTPEEMAHFRYIEHAENVQLALAVCAEAGVSRDVALRGMQSAHPDPGALRKYVIHDGHKVMHFYNIFAANDPKSTVRVMNMITNPLGKEEKIIMLNSRGDRMYRSQQLLDKVRELDFSYLLLTGEVPEKVEVYALHIGIPRDKIITLGEVLPEIIYQKALELTDSESHILGIGNMAGKVWYGAQIVAHFKHKARKQNEELKWLKQ